MRSLRLLAPLLLVLAFAAAGAAASAAPALAAADGVTRGTIYQDGPDNRYLLGGDWLFRRDDAGPGPAPVLPAPAEPRRLGAADRPQRLERRRRLGGVDDRHRRLVSQGLPPARRPRAAGLARALRVGQLPLARLAQRRADRPQHRRLPAVGPAHPAQRAEAQRHEPARHPRRQPPPAHRLPALRPDRLGRPGRRLVELRRPAARGLPAARRPHRHHERRRAPRAALRDLRGDRARARRRAQLRRPHGAREDHRQLRRRAAEPRHARASARAGSASFETRLRVARPRLWSPASPYLYPARFTVRAGKRRVLGYKLSQRDPLDHGRPAATCCSTAARCRLRGVGLHEDDPVDGLCDRQRAPRADHRPGQGARRDGASARTIRCIRRCTSSPTASGCSSGRRSPSTRSRRSTSSARPSASSPPASSRTTSSPTRTTRRSCSGRSATSCRRGRARSSSSTSSARRARPRRWTRRAPSRSPSPATRRPAAGRSTPRSTSSASTTTSAGIPGPNGQIADRDALPGLPGLRARLLSEQGDLRLGVRRRGQPRRAGGGEGHLRSTSRTS